MTEQIITKFSENNFSLSMRNKTRNENIKRNFSSIATHNKSNRLYKYDFNKCYTS